MLEIPIHACSVLLKLLSQKQWWDMCCGYSQSGFKIIENTRTNESEFHLMMALTTGLQNIKKSLLSSQSVVLGVSKPRHFS